MLYKIYNYFGDEGLVIFRSLLLSSFLFLTYIRSKLLGISESVSLFLVCLVGFNLFGFTGLRPQLFGFGFALFIFLLIDLFEQSGKIRYLTPLPALAVVWANTHGSFILGIVLLLLHSMSRIFECKIKQNKLPNNLKTLFIFAAVFSLFAAVNPNGFEAIRYIFELKISDLQLRTTEYTSALKIYTYGYSLAQFWVYLFYSLALIALPRLFKLSPSKAIITLFLGAISIDSFRYYLFFILISGPYVMQSLLQYGKIKKTIKSLLTLPLKYIAPFIILIGTFTLLRTNYKTESFPDNINATRYPIILSRYCSDKNIHGYMFNYFGWGGYLIWNLYPDIKPYIDGRMLDDSKLDKYMNILWATKEGIKYFKNEHFDYVMVPYFKPGTKQVYALNLYLQNQTDWTAIYRGNHGFLYRKIGVSK